MQAADKVGILGEVSERVLTHYSGSPSQVEAILLDTIYDERKRLEKTRKGKSTAKAKDHYSSMYRNIVNGSPLEHRDILREVTSSFATEVVGHFSPKVYSLTTKVIPPGLNLLLNTVTPLKLAGSFLGARLTDQLKVMGDIDGLKAACERGTVVMVPTHVSNLDSIILGFGLYKLNLPPFTYGAGLNLFNNKLTGFFMSNLGAYKVDRMKKAKLYKDVLKTYAGCTIENRYHNLFFPGGTRSRSGGVERKVKKGLLGMPLDAYIRNLRANKDRPDVFIVPCTLNYQMVLEAATLIDDHLKEVGKSRYIIEDDEFSKPKRILDFVSKIFSLSSEIQWVIGSPLDVFGNEVNQAGESLDQRGRVVDRKKYVEISGEYVFDKSRDTQYVHELASEVVASFAANTVLNSTHVVCYVVWHLLCKHNEEISMYRLIRTGGRFDSLPLADVYPELEIAIRQLRRLAKEQVVRIDASLDGKDVIAIMGEALAHMNSYHKTAALKRRGDRLFFPDRKLLLYYQNRLDSLEILPRKGA